MGMQNKGQSLLEYSVVIFCIVMALLSMKFYLKRGIQAKLRESADQISKKQFSAPLTRTSIDRHLLFNVTYEDNYTVTDVDGTQWTGRIVYNDELNDRQVKIRDVNY